MENFASILPTFKYWQLIQIFQRVRELSRLDWARYICKATFGQLEAAVVNGVIRGVQGHLNFSVKQGTAATDLEHADFLSYAALQCIEW